MITPKEKQSFNLQCLAWDANLNIIKAKYNEGLDLKRHECGCDSKLLIQ